MIMGETGQSRARLVGEEYLDLPDFSDMHELSGHKVDTLLKTIGQCERGQNFARTYLLQVLVGLSNTDARMHTCSRAHAHAHTRLVSLAHSHSRVCTHTITLSHTHTHT